MAEWKRYETGRSFNPYFYMCEYGPFALSVSLPYKSDPWGCRLTMNGSTIHKDHFRLRHQEVDPYKDGPEKWESADDLEKAKAQAFRIMEGYIKRHVEYWQDMLRAVMTMKEAGNGKKEQEKDHGTDR